MLQTKLSESAVLSGLSKVPPFPPIAARLLVLLANESVQIDEIAELVGSDPTFSARLLQRVNSVEFGLTGSVSDVRRALTLLGLDQTRQITVTRATAAYTKGSLGSDDLRRCWQHTVATAILADQIAKACGAFVDVAYTAGIIHDIGRLGLLVAYPREYERVIRDAAERCLDLLDYECEQFGVHHAEAGRILSERWGLPAEFRIIAGRHHDPCEGGELDLLRIVHVACRLADALGFEITRPLVTLSIDVVLSELPGRARERFQSTPDEWRSQIEKRIQAFGQNEPDDAAEPALAPPEPPTENESAPAIGAEYPPEPDPNSIPSWRGVFIAVALTGALIAVSALLLWR
jgi:putative nucleotidyltransferase with HDIG domain